jgi:pimeloyl-ACP methyl ester carboxylesterase
MRVVIGVLVGTAGLALSLVVAGVVYQRQGFKRDRRRLAPGEMVEIGGGRRVYVLRKGRGAPAVVFEAGFVAMHLNWRKVQEVVAARAETVAYDRPGLGWSAGPVTERTPRRIAAELQEMLRAAGVKGPFVLVGHSFGGLVMRRFALDYPEDVAGVVLVDPMRTVDWPPVNERQGGTVANAQRITRIAVAGAHMGVARLILRSLLCGRGVIAAAAGRVGGSQGRRLLERLTGEVGKMPEETRAVVATHWGSPGFFWGMRAHLDSLRASVVEMHDAPAIEGVPVVVLTPLEAEPLSAEELERVGKGARQVIAHRSKHWVHLDEPELVVAEIFKLLNA